MIPMPPQPQMAQPTQDDNAWEAILAELGISPEDFASLVQGSTAPEQMGVTNDEMGRMDAMRNAPMQGMRDVGRVSVAASPLEALANGLTRVQGAQGLEAGQSKLGGIIDMLRKGRGAGMKIGAMDRLGPRTGNLDDLKLDPYGEDEWSSVPALLRRPQG